MKVPNIKASNVVMPTRPSVHGRAWVHHRVNRFAKTGRQRDAEIEGDHVLPVRRRTGRGGLWCVVPPSSARSEWSACGLRCGCSATRTCAGLPGMRRGIMKLRLIAAHRVTAKKPNLRRTNLMLPASHPAQAFRLSTCSTGAAGRHPSPALRTVPAGRRDCSLLPNPRCAGCRTGTSRPAR